MNNFTQLRTIFFALLVGHVGFAAVVYYISGINPEAADVPIFSILVPAALFGAAAMAYFLNQQLAVKEVEEKDKEERFALYRRRVIVRLAMMEGANLLAVVAALMTGKTNFFLFFLIGLLVFVYFQPKEAEIGGL